VKKSLIEFYDKLSKNYINLYGEEQLEKWLAIKEYLINKDIKEKIVVDLGCGIGFIDVLNLKNKKIGLDISFESLKLAKNKYEFLVNCDLEFFCFKKFNNKNFLLISVSSLQNLNEKAINKILSLNNLQIHSVMYRSKGEIFWKELFYKKGFKFIKKIRNDLIFSNF